MTQARRSPLFYVGDKYKLIPQLIKYFPTNINTFYEPFVGGGSVFLNVSARKYVLNDIDKDLINIHKLLKSFSNKPRTFFKKVEDLIYKYGLSRSYKEDIVSMDLKKEYNKTYYARFNKKAYKRMKDDYNGLVKKDPIILYLLLIYGFNRMLRFNREREFNLPVGNVDFNRNVIIALENYFKVTKNLEIHFGTLDFTNFLRNQKYSKSDFVYVDPPYLITASEYNKYWNKSRDGDLFEILDLLDSKGVSFALSNVTNYNGDINELLISWMKKYKVNEIKSNYISFNDNSTKKRIREVLITNYV